MTTATASRKTLTPASPANSLNPAIGEIVELATRGNVSIQAENKLGVSHDDFLLLAHLELAHKEMEQAYISASELSHFISPEAKRIARDLKKARREEWVSPQSVTGQFVEKRINETDSHTISRRLRALAEDGHVDAVQDKGWRFSLRHSLDDFYPWTRTYIPGAKCGQFYGSSVLINRFNNSDRLLMQKNELTSDGWGFTPSVGRWNFINGMKIIANQILKGESDGFCLVEADNAPSGKKMMLALFPYTVRKGLRKKTFVGLKFILADGLATVSWRGTQWEVSFFDGLVEPQDLLNAACLLEDRRTTECGD